ncbi:MAG TPA: DNA alkylation repair protein [Anaerolineae bacterium]|nr:DNA alkylation repair protein [Anaerolineae bacterium]
MLTADNVAEWVQMALEARADETKAEEMAAYMKYQSRFYGVPSPLRKEIEKELKKQLQIESYEAYERAVLSVWAIPYREGQYMALTVARQPKKFIRSQSLPLYERLVREGAWWDLVDEIANHLVGAVWRRERAAVGPLMDEWIEDEDIWIRRVAILGQLTHKGETDETRLYRYCEAQMGESEFFIRKAIGWALRQYSKVEPEGVKQFLERHRADLSGLSYREGAKWLKKEGYDV